MIATESEPWRRRAEKIGQRGKTKKKGIAIRRNGRLLESAKGKTR